MPEIRNLDQLQDALDEEMGWRVKEIGAFRVASKSNGPERRFFIRAGVALVYAHWEGFIKAASDHYLQFVHNRGLIPTAGEDDSPRVAKPTLHSQDRESTIRFR